MSIPMPESDAIRRTGARVDGFFGEDVLQEFSAVRIDYKTYTLEVER